MKIGITGHQNLGDDDTQIWVLMSLLRAMRDFKISEGLTSLAFGADQLFAHMLSAIKIPFVAIIPCRQYEQTFKSEERLTVYRTLLKKAKTIVTLPFEKPEGIAFYEAGKLVVDSSEVMLAVWNGEKARNLGGTGDAVEYALSKKKKILHINPVNRKIAEIG